MVRNSLAEKDNRINWVWEAHIFPFSYLVGSWLEVLQLDKLLYKIV